MYAGFLLMPLCYYSDLLIQRLGVFDNIVSNCGGGGGGTIGYLISLRAKGHYDSTDTRSSSGSDIERSRVYLFCLDVVAERGVVVVWIGCH